MSPSSANKTSPLRLWPGVVALVLLFATRFGLKLLIPGFAGFSRGMLGGLLFGLAIVLWWLFASRAALSERLGGPVLLAGAVLLAWSLRHESMGPHWLVGYALPSFFLAFVAWAVLTRHLRAPGRRWSALVATLLLTIGAWSLVRTKGVDGDHDGIFAWRFATTSEERLLADAEPALAAIERPHSSPTAPRVEAAPLVGAETAWPGFRGPQRDGRVPGVHLDLGEATAEANAAAPEELWRRPVGPGWSSFAVEGGLVYTQEQRGDDEAITAYRLGTGEPAWIHRDPVRFFESNAGAGPRATPTVADGRVYGLGATGLLNALDARTGERLWSRDLVADTGAEIPDWGFSASPLVLRDPAVVIVAAAGQPVAYDAKNGELRWSGPADGTGYASPQLAVIDGMPQVLLPGGAGTAAFDPADGTLLWRHDWAGFPIVQPAQPPEGDLLVNAGEGSGLRRLGIRPRTAPGASPGADPGVQGWTVEERWSSRGLKPYFNDFVIHEGHAYGFDGRILSAIELETGERRWKGGRYGSGQLILLPDSDLLLVLSEDGELVLVDAVPEGFVERVRWPAVDGKTWNHPVLVGDLLLVRNSEQMAAFRLPFRETGGRLAER